MRTRTNHSLKRLISICIVLALLLSNIVFFGTIAHAAATSFEEVTLSLNSNIVDDESVNLYVKDSVYYISIEDLCELARCSWTKEGDVIGVTQGFWGTTFDIESQVFDDGYQTVDVTIMEVAPNKYAVAALMFLNYFKAVAFIENDTLYCEMPEFTAWEALDVDYANTLVDIYELYGGEGNVTLSLTLDIIMDFIMGDISTSDDYLSDAFLTALKVDLYGYDSVQKYKETSQGKLYAFLHSDKGEEFVEAVDDVLSVAAEPTQWYIQYYYNAVEKSFVGLAYDAYEAGQHADVTHYGEKFYEAFTEKNKTSETAEKYFDNADYVMLFVSAAVDTAQQMKYTNATDNLIYNVMGQENLDYLGITPSEDNGWFTVANRYKHVLGVATTQLEADAMQFFTDKLCWETLIGTGVSSAAGISGGAWTFSLNFARLFVEKFPLTSSSVEAFKADRRALYLSELQQNVYWVALNTLQDMQGQWDNPEIYTKYIQALQLYCRTSITMYENLITMVDEFGQNRDYWTNLFQSRIDMLAVSLYQLTMLQDDGVKKCLPLELKSFSIITDQKRLTQINRYEEGTIQTKTNFCYNDKNQIIQIDSSTFGEYSSDSQTVLTYDNQGRLISSISGDPDIPGMNSGSEYTYNNKGQVVRVFSWEGGAGETLYEYDSDGNRIRKTENYDVGTYVTEYNYDTNGLLVSSITRCMESGGNSWTETTTYSYDSEYRLVQEVCEGGYSNTSYTYDYTFENFVIEEYRIDDVRSNVRVYYYSTLGNDTCVIHFLENPQFYADASGRLAKIVDTYTTQGEVKSSVYEFFYNEEVALPLDAPTDTAVCYEPVVAHTYEEAEKLLYEYFGGIYGFDGLEVRQVSSQSKGIRFEMTISGEGGAPIYVIEWYKVDLDTGEVRDANSYKLICDLW